MADATPGNDQARIQGAIAAVAAVDGLSMEPAALVSDLLDMARVYGDSFEEAVSSLCGALDDVVNGRVSTSTMKYDYADYRSYHFQSHVEQGQPADMRVLFKAVDGGIEVLAFGNRHVPADFYLRFHYRLP